MPTETVVGEAKRRFPMKTLIAALALLIPTMCLAGDADDILAVLQANFEACNREDAEALLATCSVDMPDRQGFKEESIRLWRDKDIHYSLVDFKLVKVDGDIATAMIVQKTHSTDRKSSNEKERLYRNGTTLLPDAETVKYMAAFKRDRGVWKCYLTISEPVPVR